MSKAKKAVTILLIVLIVLMLIVVGGYLLIQARYPMEYRELIWTAAEKYDLDPYLVCKLSGRRAALTRILSRQRGPWGSCSSCRRLPNGLPKSWTERWTRRT